MPIARHMACWRQHRLSMQTALRCSIHKNLLKLVAEAFEMWQIASVSGLALPDPLGETSLDLLEVSASTQHAQSGKDTEAPDDVNRTLSDLSGLTFTEGSPILPLAFESSPEDVLKGYSQWIPNSASSPKEIQEIVGERLQELRKVPQAFQESATCTSSPQGSQGPQATAFRVPVAPVAFLASRCDLVNQAQSTHRKAREASGAKPVCQQSHLWSSGKNNGRVTSLEHGLDGLA